MLILLVCSHTSTATFISKVPIRTWVSWFVYRNSAICTYRL